MPRNSKRQSESKQNQHQSIIEESPEIENRDQSECRENKNENRIENISEDENIEKIFTCENPTNKDILVILKEIFKSQQFLAAKYDEILIRNLELEKICENLRTENVTLQKEAQHMKEDLIRIEKTLNGKKIEIHGIPEYKNEDIYEIVKKIGDSFEYTIRKENIDEAYRINNQNKNKKNNPIVVSFLRKIDKEEFLSKRKKRSLFTNEIGISESKMQIFINEYLNKRMKNLLWQTKTIKIEKKYKFLWIKNGSIFLRKNENSKVIKIDVHEDLKNID